MNSSALCMLLATALTGSIAFNASSGARAYSGQPHTNRQVAEIGLMWRQVALMPEAASRPAVATGRDGNLYVFGGASSSTVSNGTFIYHPDTNTWTEGASMPTAREGAQAVTLPNGRILVMGGEAKGLSGGCTTELCQDGVVYDNVEEYNPSSNTWRALAPLMTPRYRFAAVLYRGLVYALGGVDGRSALSRVEVYNLHQNAWSYAAPLPQPEAALTAAITPRGRLIVMGGWAGVLHSAVYDNTFIFDGSEWTSGSSLRQATQDAHATVGADGLIYVVGGFNGDYLSTVQTYNPQTNLWSIADPLPNGLCCLGLVTAPSGQIFAFGGSSSTIGGGGPDRLVYEFGPSVNLATNHVTPGNTDYLSGGYFAANTTVTLYWGGFGSHTVLGHGLTDSSGIVTRPLGFRIPCAASLGVHHITAVDSLSYYPATTLVTVTKGMADNMCHRQR